MLKHSISRRNGTSVRDGAACGAQDIVNCLSDNVQDIITLETVNNPCTVHTVFALQPSLYLTSTYVQLHHSAINVCGIYFKIRCTGYFKKAGV